jgi:hypothetical protein
MLALESERDRSKQLEDLFRSAQEKLDTDDEDPLA